MKYNLSKMLIFSIFWGFILLASLYIATISAPGIYYDYRLIPEYPLIANLNYGKISVEEFLTQLVSFEREIQFINFGGARFHPFYMVDFVLIIKYLGSVKWAWVYEATLFLIFILALYKTTERLIPNKYLPGFAVLLLFLHPGFWYVWTTLASTTEAQTMAFLSLSLFFYMRFSHKGGYLNASMCIAAVLIAFGFKELTFVAVGAFAAIHALLNFRSDNYRLKKMDVLLLVATFLFFLLYFGNAIWPLIRDGFGDQDLYFLMKNRGAGLEYGLGAIFQHLKVYARTDPFLIFVMLPLALLHFVQLAKGRSSARDKLVAAFFAGGVVWLLQLIVLGVSDAHFQYYAIPAYCFAIPALKAKLAEIFSVRPDVESRPDYSYLKKTATRLSGILFLKQTANGRSQFAYTKITTSMLVVLSLGTQVFSQPRAIDWFLNNRYDYQHWAKIIDESAKLVKQNQPERTYFYLYKSPRSSTIELHESFTAFMVAKGLLPKDFDLTYASNDNIAWSGHRKGVEFGLPESPWGWRRNFQARPMQAGDYLIISSWWPFYSNNEIEKVSEDFELVFATGALYGCETLSIIGASRYLYRSAGMIFNNLFPAAAESLFSEATFRDFKLYQEHGMCSPLSNRRNFYIFKKKP